MLTQCELGMTFTWAMCCSHKEQQLILDMGMVKGFVIAFILSWQQQIGLQDLREGHICKVVAAHGATGLNGCVPQMRAQTSLQGSLGA